MHDETLPESGFKEAHYCSMNISAHVESLAETPTEATAAGSPKR